MKAQSRKTKFRASAKWKRFRAYMKAKHKKDYITGYPLRKGWNLHHLDMNEEHYEDVTKESHFMCLNKMTHETVHNLYRYFIRDEKVLNRLSTVLKHMKKINEGKDK